MIQPILQAAAEMGQRSFHGADADISAAGVSVAALQRIVQHPVDINRGTGGGRKR